VRWPFQIRPVLWGTISCRRPSRRGTLGLSIGDWPCVAQVIAADELERPRCDHYSYESSSIVDHHALMFLIPSQNAVSVVSFDTSRRSGRESMNKPTRSS
jgi:hypothetical protein